MKLRRELGLPDEEIHPDVWDRVVPALDVVKLMSCDTVQVGPGASLTLPGWTPRDTYTDESGVQFVRTDRPAGGVHRDAGHPIKEPRLTCSITAYTWPDPYDPSRYVGVADQVRWLYENTDYAIFAKMAPTSGKRGTIPVDRPGGWSTWPLSPTSAWHCSNEPVRSRRLLHGGLKCMGPHISVLRLARILAFNAAC